MTGSVGASGTRAARSMAAEGVDGSGPLDRPTCVRQPPWNEILLAGTARDSGSIDQQCVKALHHDHLFVEVVRMLRRSTPRPLE